MRLKLPFADVDTERGLWVFSKNLTPNPVRDTPSGVLLELMTTPIITEANIHEDSD